MFLVLESLFRKGFIILNLICNHLILYANLLDQCVSPVQSIQSLNIEKPRGGGSAKMWSSMLEKNLGWNVGKKLKTCVESCGHKMGVKFVRVGVIWV